MRSMPEEEDFFEHRYFVTNKRFMTHIGSWPFKNDRPSRLRRLLYLLAFVSGFLVEFVRFLQYWPNASNVFRVIPSMFTRVLILIKWYNLVLQPAKMKRLLEHIRWDWEHIQDVSEQIMMEAYGETGRRMVILYTGYIYASMTMYMMIPYAPAILDVLLPLNQSRERKFLYDAEYFVDPDEYYFYVAAHALFTTVIAITILIAIDVMYMIYGNHACSQFAVACSRLENSFERTVEKGRDVYADLVVTVKKHKRAMEFATYIEDSFKLSMLIQVMLCILCISITGVQVVHNMDDTDEVMRLSVYGAGQVLHLFFLNYPGQRVMDHSNQIFRSTYSARWYQYSIRVQKTLQLILMRSLSPCVFTFGKFGVLSMETFLSVVQTTMSYFTVLSSV